MPSDHHANSNYEDWFQSVFWFFMALVLNVWFIDAIYFMEASNHSPFERFYHPALTALFLVLTHALCLIQTQKKETDHQIQAYLHLAGKFALSYGILIILSGAMLNYLNLSTYATTLLLWLALITAYAAHLLLRIHRR